MVDFLSVLRFLWLAEKSNYILILLGAVGFRIIGKVQFKRAFSMSSKTISLRPSVS